MHRVDAFGNSSGVCRKLTEGIGSLPGWGEGVRQKKIETHRKIVGGSRKAYRESRCSDDAVGSRRKFARRFAEGTRNSLGTRRKIAGKNTGGLTARLLEVTGLYGIDQRAGQHKSEAEI
ncbi:hypothetical protein B296_00045531 [Ensete ventricosum]|uniref:Uncharacterized protein n=1 Tax=Ensete ventricosum TaxID=4639 RepID=A0A426X049_ENSVE|nr:hypothetical protein B296_00045531 [Ensete ventricosum]